MNRRRCRHDDLGSGGCGAHAGEAVSGPAASGGPGPRQSLSQLAAAAVARYVPISRWLPRYQREWLRFDLVAGLTSWGVMVPVALAYAGLAGVPPELGLVTAFTALAAYAVFGTSRHLKVTVSSTMAVMSAAVVADLARGDPATYLALTRGARADGRGDPRGGRARAARVRLRLPVEVGGDRVHLRPRDHGRRRPAAEAPRGPERQRHGAGAVGAARRLPGGREPVHARRRWLVAGAHPRPAPRLAAHPRSAHRPRSSGSSPCPCSISRVTG